MARPSRSKCAPCKPYKPLDLKTPKAPHKRKDCPKTVEELCRETDAQFEAWYKWGVGVNDTLKVLAETIWRLEHAVCCLEGHVIHGHARPTRSLICDAKGNFKLGTLHRKKIPTWPITPPPQDPWNV